MGARSRTESARAILRMWGRLRARQGRLTKEWSARASAARRRTHRASSMQRQERFGGIASAVCELGRARALGHAEQQPDHQVGPEQSTELLGERVGPPL